MSHMANVAPVVRLMIACEDVVPDKKSVTLVHCPARLVREVEMDKRDKARRYSLAESEPIILLSEIVLDCGGKELLAKAKRKAERKSKKRRK